MTIPVYPDLLPLPQRADYGLQHASPTRQTDLASGHIRSRRVFRSVPTTVQVRWLFRTESAAAYFEAWFRDTLLDGTLWFSAPLQTPLGIRNYECKFAGMYEGPALVGPVQWQISARLTLRERQLLPVGYGAVDLKILSLADVVDRAVNHEWPEA